MGIGLGGSDLSREMDGVENLSRAGAPGGGGKKPEEMSPEELHATLWQILKFRDGSELHADFFLHSLAITTLLTSFLRTVMMKIEVTVSLA